MEEDADATVLQTLYLLEERLRRLEFVLHGSIKDGKQQAQVPVSKRLQRLEDSLREVTSGSGVMSDVMLLRMQRLTSAGHALDS